MVRYHSYANIPFHTIVLIMWLKQCHKHHPQTKNKGGTNQPFPVLGGHCLNHIPHYTISVPIINHLFLVYPGTSIFGTPQYIFSNCSMVTCPNQSQRQAGGEFRVRPAGQVAMIQRIGFRFFFSGKPRT